MPDLPKVTPEMMGTLKTLGQICDYLTRGPADAAPSVPNKTPEVIVSAPAARHTIEVVPAPAGSKDLLKFQDDHYLGVVCEDFDRTSLLIEALARRDAPARALIDPAELGRDPGLRGLILAAPLSPYKAFEWARAAAPLLNAASQSADVIFATVTFLDGAFGFGPNDLTDPSQGALAGLAKTAALEWPRVRCRAVDVEPKWDAAASIDTLAGELLSAGTRIPLEIGLSAERRVTLALTPEPASSASDSIRLDDSDVVVVTGGARGVTAAACIALASATRCRLALIGRSPEPSEEPHWLAALSDEGAIKKALLERQLGANATPKALSAAYHSAMANRQILRTLAQVKHRAAMVRYFSADVSDADAVRTVFKRIRAELGPIRALIHGAGVLEDRLIADKLPEQFARVYDTKVIGLENLLNAASEDELRYLLIFSSVSARMGNIGQADYAMANEALNKTARSVALKRPGCKVAALNWGPWDGGMVTPALKRSFEKQGVALISMEQGTAALLAEMNQAPDGPVEVVIGGPLPVASFPDQAGNRPSAADATSSRLAQTARREIDVERYPVLKSHCLDGRPVVPLALITEWLAHGALHANPGMALHGIDNLRLLKGITLEEGRKTIRLMAGKPLRKGTLFEVDVEIRDGVKDGLEVIHSQAKAILADRLPPAPRFEENGHFKGKSPARSMEEIYERLLFHGHHLRGIRRIIAISKKGLSAEVESAPAPERWMVEPMRSRWIADPLVLDCAFQMAIIWCREEKGMPSLPSFAAAYRQYRDRFPEQGVISILEIESTTDRKMVGNYLFLDAHKQVVAELKGFEAIMDPALNKAFRS